MDGLRLVEPRAYAEQGYPHAEWKALRKMPLTHFEPPGWQPFWAITKHADVIEVSKQPERFLNGPGMTIIRKRDEAAQGSFMQMRTLINRDAPDHRKYRETMGSLLRELLPRLEHVELAGTPQRAASNLVPGLEHLPIRYRIRPAARA